MTYTFGKPEAIEQTIVGEKDKAATYISIISKIKVNVRVSEGTPGREFEHGDWEPALRQKIAEAVIGIAEGNLTVDTCAITRFHDA